MQDVKDVAEAKTHHAAHVVYEKYVDSVCYQKYWKSYKNSGDFIGQKVLDKVRGLIQVEDEHAKEDEEWGSKVENNDREGNYDGGQVSVGSYQ